MPVTRIFIDWNKPFLPQAVEWLCACYADETSLDMRGHVLVFPGQGALRRCTELLSEKAAEAGLVFVPPRMTTSGELPDLIGGLPEDRVSDTQCIFAWISALQSTSPARLPVLVPQPPEPSDFSSWLLLAERIHQIYEELAGGCIQFADVPDKLRARGSFPDDDRWELFAEIYASYRVALESQGLKDRHIRRSDALSNDLRLRGDLVLMSIVDLNEISRRMIEGLKTEVTALIHAPQNISAGFDSFGSIDVPYWLSAHIPVQEEQYDIVEKAWGQGSAVLRRVAADAQGVSTTKIRIGLCDRSIGPFVKEAFAAEGIPVRDAGGIPFRTSSVFIALKTLQQFLALRRFQTFASLLRVPEIETWMRAYLSSQGRHQFAQLDYLTALDSYQEVHLQAEIGQKIFGKGETSIALSELYDALQVLMGDFATERQDVAAWAHSFSALLSRIFTLLPVPEDETSREVVYETLDALHSVAEEYASINPGTLVVDGAQALALFLRSLSSLEIRSTAVEPAVEMAGWLELRLDDAPFLFIAGFNEGFVPESLNADPFLPDSVRRALGILDNDRRYARDAYSFSAMLHSKEKLYLTGAHENTRGDKLLPSRLLYAGSKEEVVRRVARIFAKDRPYPLLPADEETAGSFVLPRKPEKLDVPLRSIPVSGFNSYLACPYRFYLGYVLGLSTMDDSMLELDAMQFGTLGHEVLADFGESKLKDSTDPSEITKELHAALDRIAAGRFGRHVLPAVLVQIEQLKKRLHGFAAWQAAWRESGWQIKEIERSFEDDFILVEPEGPLQVTGRIDRVDYHSGTGQYIIFDYKFGEKAKTPDRAHRRRKSWVDLQLPVYLHYAEKVRGLKNAGAGYICLPQKLEHIREYRAEWTDEELEEARNVMHLVARNILRQEFWPPSDTLSGADDFAVLCGGGQFGVAAEEALDE